MMGLIIVGLSLISLFAGIGLMIFCCSLPGAGGNTYIDPSDGLTVRYCLGRSTKEEIEEEKRYDTPFWDAMPIIGGVFGVLGFAGLIVGAAMCIAGGT